MREDGGSTEALPLVAMRIGNQNNDRCIHLTICPHHVHPPLISFHLK
jgi:hypothetical protein